MWASAVLAIAASVAMASTAQASTFSFSPGVVEIGAKSKTKAAKKSKGGKISFNDGSAESRSERDRRLKRECKGRSNSGLCEGYTR
jgi:hypothetical protein